MKTWIHKYVQLIVKLDFPRVGKRNTVIGNTAGVYKISILHRKALSKGFYSL